MFLQLGHLVYKWRWIIITTWMILLAVSLPFAPRLATTLRPGGFASGDLEAARAERAIEQQLGQRGNHLVAVFSSDGYPDGYTGDGGFVAAVDSAVERVRGLRSVAGMISPRDNPRQVSSDRQVAYALIAMDVPAEGSRAMLRAVQTTLQDGKLNVLVTGAPAFYGDIEDVSERDLRRAEMVAFPLGLLALVIVLRSIVSAAVPIVVGAAGVAGALAVLFVIGQQIDLSIFVLNMATMLGLGLSIDYALFLTSRCREELSRHEPAEAVAIAVGTAGKAVFFSALTVLTGLLGLISFDSMMLRSLGIGGLVVVVSAAVAALTLLPALLGVLGHRINALSLPRLPFAHEFSWARLARTVMRHPVAVALPVLAFLLLLGLPFAGVRLSSPDATILPSDTPSRQGLEVLRQEFGEGEIFPILVVLESNGSILDESNVDRLYDFTHQLGRDPRVERVSSIVDLDPRIRKEQYQLIYKDPGNIGDPYAKASVAALANNNTTLVTVVSKYPMNSEESKGLVRDIRRLAGDSGWAGLVGGGPAGVVDYVGSLYAEMPRAVGLVILTTYVALLLLFRSAVLPLKAIIMNTLSILASYGALVVVFQDGHFSNWLGFSPAGFVEASLPIVMFCFLFGISMDYEVFLLSRIKETYERTNDNTASVAEGLERSGRIITSAALIVVVVSASFVAADIVLIKALGLGTAIAVLLDATIVRALLVPAAMRLLGDLNWWMPDRHSLRRLRSLGADSLRHGLRFGVPALLAAGLVTTLVRWDFGPARTTAAPQSSMDKSVSKALETPRPVVFPDDDAPHDSLTEWWYYTGHLETPDHNQYGFELVVFQSRRSLAPTGYAAHFAITDPLRGFHYDQRAIIATEPQGAKGFDLQVGDWTIGGAGSNDHLHASMAGYTLDLDLASTKPPALQGKVGVVSFGPAGDSYYYSRTRMSASGSIEVNGHTLPVRGSAWMDHQWGNFIVLNQGGWDWFGLQLSDGSELSVSRVRSADGQLVVTYGTLVGPDGEVEHIDGEDMIVTEMGSWHSTRSQATYPAAWRIEIERKGIALDVKPVQADQELDTRSTTGLIYWEGSALVNGLRDGKPIAGRGYVELTGYVGQAR